MQLVMHRRVLPCKAVMEMFAARRKVAEDEAAAAAADADGQWGDGEEQRSRGGAEAGSSGSQARPSPGGGGRARSFDADEAVSASSSLPSSSSDDDDARLAMLRSGARNTQQQTWSAEEQRGGASSSASLDALLLARGMSLEELQHTLQANAARGEPERLEQLRQRLRGEQEERGLGLMQLSQHTPHAQAVPSLHHAVSTATSRRSIVVTDSSEPGNPYIGVLADMLAQHNDSPRNVGVAIQPEAYDRHIMLYMSPLQTDLLRRLSNVRTEEVTLEQLPGDEIVRRLEEAPAVVLRVPCRNVLQAFNLVSAARNAVFHWHLKALAAAEDRGRLPPLRPIPTNIAVAVLPHSPDRLKLVVYGCRVGFPSQYNGPDSRPKTLSELKDAAKDIKAYKKHLDHVIEALNNSGSRGSGSGSEGDDKPVSSMDGGKESGKPDRVLDQLD